MYFLYFAILLITSCYFTTINTSQPIDCSNKPNEHYECGSACQKECATLQQPCPIINIRCNDACYCNEGYARNSSGACIPVNNCVGDQGTYECSRPHEVFYKCGSPCQTTCKNLGKRCPLLCDYCYEECYCEDGYARDDNGYCIPIEECPQFKCSETTDCCWWFSC